MNGMLGAAALGDLLLGASESDAGSPEVPPSASGIRAVVMSRVRGPAGMTPTGSRAGLSRVRGTRTGLHDVESEG